MCHVRNLTDYSKDAVCCRDSRTGREEQVHGSAGLDPACRYMRPTYYQGARVTICCEASKSRGPGLAIMVSRWDQCTLLGSTVYHDCHKSDWIVSVAIVVSLQDQCTLLGATVYHDYQKTDWLVGVANMASIRNECTPSWAHSRMERHTFEAKRHTIQLNGKVPPLISFFSARLFCMWQT